MPIKRGQAPSILRDETGQSAVEFFFTVPFLIMILTMSIQFFLVHRAKFDAAVEHRNNAIRHAMEYNAASGNSMRAYYEPPVEKKVSIVIGSKAFPSGLKVSSSDRGYMIYMGTGKH